MNFQVWERQLNESSQAWGAFQVYRNLGTKRSLSNVVKELGRPKGYVKMLEVWSVKYGWVERCRYFDNYCDRIKSEAIQQARREEYFEMINKVGNKRSQPV